MADREGFEPSVLVTQYDDLANRCLKPLGHRSVLYSSVLSQWPRSFQVCAFARAATDLYQVYIVSFETDFLRANPVKINNEIFNVLYSLLFLRK